MRLAHDVFKIFSIISVVMYSIEICLIFKIFFLPNIVCPKGFFGDNCIETCDCRNNATCNHENGECICKPGWKGRFCDKGIICTLYELDRFVIFLYLDLSLEYR